LIIKRIYNSADANVEKSSVADIWKQIDEDLDYADAHLPLHWEAPYSGRITSGASKTLHAKAYIFRSMWTETLNKTQEVINSAQYSLSPNYYDNFNYSKALGPESIFEIQAFGSPGGTQRYDCEWAEPQQARGSGDWNLGWGWNIPDDPLVNAFETRDPRRNYTVLTAGKPVGLYGITDSVPQSSLIAGAKYLNAKVFTDPAIRKAYADQGSHFLNHLMLRYADVLLMNDEAARSTTGEIIDQSTVTPPTQTPTTPPETTSTTPTPEPKSPTDPKTPDPKAPTEPGKAPEAYTDFTLPEGLTLSKEAIDAATPIFKELGLSQEAAQKLVSFHADQLKATTAASQADAYSTMRQGWQAQTLADADIKGYSTDGKTGIDAVKVDIGRAIGTLPPALATEFKAAMDLTGAGDHPAFVKAIWKLSQAISEGKPVTGAGPSPEGQRKPGTDAKPTAAQSLYPGLPSAAR